MYRKTYIEINLTALQSNFEFLKQKAKGQWFCPMVKANAYGHGAVEVVQTLSQAGQEIFGVALIEEAIELREAGFWDIQILVFSSVDTDAAHAIDKYQLTPIITSQRELSILENTLQNRVEVHLKVNTGMNRLGISPNEMTECIGRLQNSKKMNLVALCTHLSHGEKANLSKKQISPLLEVSKKTNLPIHLLNSVAFLSHPSGPNSCLDFGFRPGISLYGLVPDLGPEVKLENDGTSHQKPNKEPYKKPNEKSRPNISEPTSSNTAPNGTLHKSSNEKPYELIPVMSLKSEIVQCHRVSSNEGVSYGWTWQAKRSSLIGVIPIGYADGFSRSLSNKAFLVVNNQRAPQIGTICMDYLMIDLTDIFATGEEAVGKTVDVFGGQTSNRVSVQDWATWSNTLSYEILSRMGLRIPRKYIGY